MHHCLMCNKHEDQVLRILSDIPMVNVGDLQLWPVYSRQSTARHCGHSNEMGEGLGTRQIYI